MTETPADGTPLDDHALRRALAKAAIRARRLPNRRPSRMWGGTGDGTACTVCQMPISPQALGYEVEFVDEDRGSAIYQLHMPCYSAWEAECASVNDGRDATNGQVNGHFRDDGFDSEDPR